MRSSSAWISASLCPKPTTSDKKEAQNWLKVAVWSRNSWISSGWLVNTWSSR